MGFDETAKRPAFGTDEWLKQYLLSALHIARTATDQLHVETERIGDAPDFDAYFHVRLRARQQKVLRWLIELSKDQPWISVSNDILRILPSASVSGFAKKAVERAEAELLVAALNEMGISAEMVESYR